MKKLILLIVLIMISIESRTQNIQQIVGQYDIDQATLVVFEDHTFMIIAYATLITGTVEIQNNEVKFIIDKNENFSIYGRKNNEIKGNSKLMFYGFNDGENYFGNHTEDKLQPIFPEVSGHYYNFLNTSEYKTFYFTQKKIDSWDPNQSENLYKFDNKEGYNDFIVLRKDNPIESFFTAHIADKGEKLIISVNGETTTAEKGRIEDEIKDMFQQKLLFKQQVGKEIFDDVMQKKYVFANPSYRQYEPQDILDTDLYTPLNDGQGTYISRTVYKENGEYDTGDPNEYHNYLRIYKYTKIKPEISEKFNGTLDTIPLLLKSAETQQEDLMEANEESTLEDKTERQIAELKAKINTLETDNKEENKKESSEYEYKIGNLYYVFLDNKEEAFRWYMHAAESGYEEAINMIGNCYAHGIGIEKDSLKGFDWYQQAAQRGSAEGKMNLAYCYLKGTGVKADSTLYFKWMMELAEQKSGPACKVIGDCYAKGIGVNKDLEESVRWYQRGQEYGDKASRYLLGLAYQNGVGITEDFDKAFLLFIKSDMNDFKVLNTLGKCNIEGLGTPKNLSTAAYFFRHSIMLIEKNDTDEIPENRIMKEEMQKALEGELKDY